MGEWAAAQICRTIAVAREAAVVAVAVIATKMAVVAADNQTDSPMVMDNLINAGIIVKNSETIKNRRINRKTIL